MYSCNSVAVQGTNDSSVVSKYSMVKIGYFSDEYIGCFVTKFARRAPLINRGYYVRAKAINTVVQLFLEMNVPCSSSIQIVSLGAGFDSLYFRIVGNCPQYHTKISFYEVDFLSVARRKAEIIKSTEKLRNLINPAELFSAQPDLHNSNEGIVLASPTYKLLGIDLCELEKLDTVLEQCGINYDFPTLLLSECAITYMNVSRSNELILWAANKFSSATFCVYEQIFPYDGFGQIMCRHFSGLNSSLRSIMEFPNIESQMRRYTELGWSSCEAIDMNTFYKEVIALERFRIETLEPFDEFEEFHQKCAHYVLLCAMKGSVHRNFFPVSQMRTNDLCTPRTLQFHQVGHYGNIKRCGHRSVSLKHHIITVGGFGVRGGDGRHSRLADLVVTDMKNQCDHTINPSLWNADGCVYHTVSLVHNSTLVIIGGRTSPLKPCTDIAVLKVISPDHTFETITAATKVTDISIVPCEGAQIRWRHSATVVHINGKENIFVFGGRNVSDQVLGDSYVLSTDTWRWSKVRAGGTVPCPRHSHAACSWNSNKVVLSGGLAANLEPLSSIHIFDCPTMEWAELHSPLVLPRYSHTAHIWRNKLILLGGVNLLLGAPPGVATIDLDTGQAREFALATMPEKFLFDKHSSVLDEVRDEIFILGGGGTCFSFGTWFNETAFCLKLVNSIKML